MAKKLEPVKEETGLALQTTTGNVLPEVYHKAKVDEVVLPADLPTIFQSAEVIDSNFPPAIGWSHPGQWAWGFYDNVRTNVGQYDSPIYTFVTPLKKGGSFRWALWGSAAVNAILSQCSLGDAVLVYYKGMVSTPKGPMHDFVAQRIKRDEINPEKIRSLEMA